MFNAAYRFPALPKTTPSVPISEKVLLSLSAAIELDEAHLHPGELEVLNRRKQPQAKREYLSSRYFIKTLAQRLFPQYAQAPLASWQSVFNEQERALQLFIDGQLLDINVVISHSHGHIAVAITQGQQSLLGVDIEKRDASRRFEKLAAHFYPEVEARDIGNNVDTFFRVWTLKEAYAKAAKQSISTLLSQPILPLLERCPAQVYCQQWRQFDLSLITAKTEVEVIRLAPAAAGE
ncbi:4'-phosphopantetheinyl transferase family protein [Pseudoalteromonas sp. T1lg10]|uniref:4'-phosphopantetheinyl transferase family protein n=1 Tax=Pseudoalteromonas sp. T1lg10 TaxID=2077093 RepID=UPI000CF6EF28|nr:4'-phosphopantetheinyl transferase superfamily protein [Pseudoalteromonas sp. T1lg10]